MNIRILVLLWVLLFAYNSPYAQQHSTRIIKLKNSDKWTEDRLNNPGVRDLEGNVWFQDGDASMYCDRAKHYTLKNAFNAEGNIHIIKSDSIHIYSKELYYDGNSKMAKLRKEVMLINTKSQLKIETEKLDYDLGKDVSYYFDGGVVTDTAFVLNSDKGYYYVATGMIHFKNKVEVVASGADIFTDTLLYDSNTEIISILGPTDLYSDSVHLYSEDGWYDPNTDYSVLKRNSVIEKSGQLIEGQHMIYNGEKQSGEAFTYVEITDTLQKIKIKGKRAKFSEQTDYAFVTDSALFIQYSGFDSLFLHADTLSFQPDTNGFRIVKAYNNVKFFRFDVQGKCDSMVYSTFDSVIYMYNEPILWSLYNQLTGNEIHIINKNNHIEQIDMIGKAFLVSRMDSIRFNQIKGKKISSYIRKNQLHKIYVDGNTESLYFLNDGPFIVGVNKVQSPYLTIFMDKNKVERVIMSPKPTGSMLDPKTATQEQTTLEDFKWRMDERPFSPWDIFKKDTPIPLK